MEAHAGSSSQRSQTGAGTRASCGGEPAAAESLPAARSAGTPARSAPRPDHAHSRTNPAKPAAHAIASVRALSSGSMTTGKVTSASSEPTFESAYSR